MAIVTQCGKFCDRCARLRSAFTWTWGGMEPSREGFLEVMSRFRIRRFNQAKVERAFQAREKGEQETEVEKQHGKLPLWLGG